jgi:hypothetical protein
VGVVGWVRFGSVFGFGTSQVTLATVAGCALGRHPGLLLAVGASEGPAGAKGQ